MKFLKSFWADKLFAESSVILFATVITGALNYFFQVLMSRKLGPIDYGTYNSLIGILMIFSIPMLSIQYTVAKYYGQFKTADQLDKIPLFINTIFRFLGILALLFMAGLSVSGIFMKPFLKLDSYVHWFWLSLMISLGIMIPLFAGAMQGAQKFYHFAIISIIFTSVKLIVGIFLASMALGVHAALLAGLISSLVYLLLCIKVVHPNLRISKLKNQTMIIQYQEVINYCIPVAVALLLFAIMTNIDVVFAKHYLPELEVGYMAAAGVIGKAFLFLPLAIVMVLFPKVSELNNENRETFPLLIKSLLFCCAISIFALLAIYFTANLLVLLLFGKQYVATTSYVQLYGWVILPYSLIQITINYKLARRQFNFFYFLRFESGMISIVNAPIINKDYFKI